MRKFRRAAQGRRRGPCESIFGPAAIETAGLSNRKRNGSIEVQVHFGDLDLEAAGVELYANGANGGAAERRGMTRVGRVMADEPARPHRQRFQSRKLQIKIKMSTARNAVTATRNACVVVIEEPREIADFSPPTHGEGEFVVTPLPQERSSWTSTPATSRNSETLDCRQARRRLRAPTRMRQDRL
jgi:hypothetical protein